MIGSLWTVLEIIVDVFLVHNTLHAPAPAAPPPPAEDPPSKTTRGAFASFFFKDRFLQNPRPVPQPKKRIRYARQPTAVPGSWIDGFGMGLPDAVHAVVFKARGYDKAAGRHARASAGAAIGAVAGSAVAPGVGTLVGSTVGRWMATAGNW